MIVREFSAAARAADANGIWRRDFVILRLNTYSFNVLGRLSFCAEPYRFRSF